MKKYTIDIPPFLKWILFRMTRYEEDFLFAGDIEEEFREILKTKGDVKLIFGYGFRY